MILLGLINLFIYFFQISMLQCYVRFVSQCPLQSIKFGYLFLIEMIYEGEKNTLKRKKDCCDEITEDTLASVYYLNAV